MSLRHSYTVIAPLYDALLAGAGTGVRATSLAQLPQQGDLHILISGIGSGLDLPYLPPCHRYTGLDLTRAMLNRVVPRIGKLGRCALGPGNDTFDLLTHPNFPSGVFRRGLAQPQHPPTATCRSHLLIRGRGSARGVPVAHLR